MNTTLLPPDPLAHLNSLSRVLAESVRGQPDAIASVVEVVESREREMTPPQGCKGALLLVGPTGAGKTEVAKGLAEALFGPGHLLRFDSSEFALPQSLEIALGDGERVKGRLATAYEQVPKGVWLFDEIEKGCTEFKNLLIQMTYEGEVTLASGQALDFSDIYVVATSNLGSREILEREHLPFETLEKHVLDRLERWFLPELLARFDVPIVFRPLSWDTQQEITRKHLDELVVWHAQRHQRALTYGDEVIEFLLADGYSPRYGARPLLRSINRRVSRAILAAIRKGANGNGLLVIDGEQLAVSPL